MKKPWKWEESLEFKEIFGREKKYLDCLRNDPLFVKEWGRVKLKGTASRIKAFCEKWELERFPRSLDEHEFCPTVGPPLDFEYDDTGKIKRLVLDLQHLTLEDLKRYWKRIEEFRKVVYDPTEKTRLYKWRDLRWFYLYKSVSGGRKYRRVAEATIGYYPSLVCSLLKCSEENLTKQLSGRYVRGGPFRKRRRTGKEDVINHLIPIVRKSISREVLRRKRKKTIERSRKQKLKIGTKKASHH